MSAKYSIITIKHDKGKYFYVSVKDDSTGKYLSKKSVDVIAKKQGISRHITSKPGAIRIIEDALKNGLCGAASDQVIPTVESYLRSFWDYDNSLYIRMKNSGKKIRIHRDYVSKNLRNCELHVFPYLPKGIMTTES